MAYAVASGAEVFSPRLELVFVAQSVVWVLHERLPQSEEAVSVGLLLVPFVPLVGLRDGEGVAVDLLTQFAD